MSSIVVVESSKKVIADTTLIILQYLQLQNINPNNTYKNIHVWRMWYYVFFVVHYRYKKKTVSQLHLGKCRGKSGSYLTVRQPTFTCYSPHMQECNVCVSVFSGCNSLIPWYRNCFGMLGHIDHILVKFEYQSY